MAFRRTEHCKETSGMLPHLDTGIIPYDLSPFSATSVWKSVQIEKKTQAGAVSTVAAKDYGWLRSPTPQRETT
jgi:hypothetical protein